MKKLKVIVVLPIAVFLVAYTLIPEKITVTKGQIPNFGWGITAYESAGDADRFDCRVRLFNCIPIKTVSVSVMPERYVIPSGEAIGVKLYTDGILVVGMSNVCGADGKIYEPAKEAGIAAGDRIVAVNGERVASAEDFSEKINECAGEAALRVVRGKNMRETAVCAVYSAESKSYKAGMWVRDSAAGIGTMTFYDPQTSSFGALGHAICDGDTGEIMIAERGSVSKCSIKSVEKGANGVPGELTGDFLPTEEGGISLNTAEGIFGHMNNIPNEKAVKVAARSEIRCGKAQILCDVDGAGAKGYSVEITKISAAKASSKSFVIKVTDSELLEKTGGIVQGMSGSPVLQDGKLVGAVTHVFVNDPKRGYGIFIENMLDVCEKAG